MATILVIEDEKPIRTYVSKILEAEGHAAICAENGEDGLDLVKQCQPDLVLCDLVMPKLNGYGVLDALKRDQNTAGIPFVFLSSKCSEEDIRQGMAMGSDDYLSKPVEKNNLLAAVAAQLQRITAPGQRDVAYAS
ncbi:MAG: response regulator [Cyanobacteriota bacterium]|nr:response regulator [Cyanobacteriota bacterium]